MKIDQTVLTPDLLSRLMKTIPSSEILKELNGCSDAGYQEMYEGEQVGEKWELLLAFVSVYASVTKYETLKSPIFIVFSSPTFFRPYLNLPIVYSPLIYRIIYFSFKL